MSLEPEEAEEPSESGAEDARSLPQARDRRGLRRCVSEVAKRLECVRFTGAFSSR
jgi:hypothetical protein